VKGKTPTKKGGEKGGTGDFLKGETKQQKKTPKKKTNQKRERGKLLTGRTRDRD